MKPLAQLLPQSGPSILQRLTPARKGGEGRGQMRTSLQESFFLILYTHVGLCLKCVYVSVPGCIYGKHMCPQAIFHPAASAEPRPPLTSPNVYQSGAARGPSLRRALQNKKTSIDFKWGHGRQSVAFMSEMHTVCMKWI